MLSTDKNTLSIEKVISFCLKKNLVFASYRLPNSENKEMIIQLDEERRIVKNCNNFFNLKGFIVAPFTETQDCPTFLIYPDIYVKNELDIESFEKLKNIPDASTKSNASHIPAEVSHDEYIEQLDEIVGKIKLGDFEKVVLSRIKIIEGNYIDKLERIFISLSDSYPNAFVYMFNSGPDLWIGATPEPLLKVKNGSMQTVSLAGTRAFSESNSNIGQWNSKERLEQEYVTRYISKVLAHFNLKNIELEGPYTKRAGNLLHLRTDFTFLSNDLKEKLGEFLNELHPTPAVCGMPRHNSFKLLVDLEKHSREYYSGYLGPINMDNTFALYVNLRCMKVLNDRLALFVGGGITADSSPEEEWQETEIKTETLLSVIRKIN